MDKVKSFTLTIAGLAVMVLPIVLLLVSIRGLAWVGDRIMGWTAAAVGWVFVADLVLLVIAIFRPLRAFSGAGFLLSSQAYGFFTLLLGFLACWHLGHWLGVIVGLLLGGVGIIPVGMVLGGFQGEWGLVGNLALGVVLWFVAMVLAGLIGQRSAVCI